MQTQRELGPPGSQTPGPMDIILALLLLALLIAALKALFPDLFDRVLQNLGEHTHIEWQEVPPCP